MDASSKNQMLSDLEELCSRNNHGRSDFIRSRIRKLGLDFTDDHGEINGVKYTNIIINLGGNNTSPHLFLTGHYDRVKKSQGALDNGAAVVELLDFLKRWNRDPAVDVTVIFFDKEEGGMRGSTGYLQHHFPWPDAVYNFDVVGRGEYIVIYDSTLDSGRAGVNCSAKLNYRIKKSCQKLGLPTVMFKEGGGSDHLPFLQWGIPATAISTYPNSEIFQYLYAGVKALNLPTLRTINGPEDKIELIEPSTMVNVRNLMLNLVDSYIKPL